MSYYISPLRFNPGFDVGFHRFESLLPRLFDDVIFSNSRHFDVDETENQYSFTLELPGFKQEHLDVTLDKDILTVTAKRESRSFKQSFRVPQGVNAEKIEAKIEDGVLSISLGKNILVKPRKISIKSA